MRRATAAALVLVATALLVLVPATAGAAPPPGELWSEFPLEPRTATTPAGSTPAPVQVVEQPAQPKGGASGADGPAVWVFILLGTVAAGSVGLVARHRRSSGRQQQPDRAGEQKPAQAVVRTFDRPMSGAVQSDASAVTVVERPRTVVPERMSPTLIETLSPQARLADQPEGRKTDVEPETHQVCEIACWRGYVTWQFYVESESPLDPSFSSPFFRARGKGAPEQSDKALRAHAVLVEKLVASGWEPEGYGEHWFSERFQRTVHHAS
jgi:hypothetical protein